MIPFTQYLMPDGRRREGGFVRSEEIEAIASWLLERGVHFDAEFLSTGFLSLTAELDSLDDPMLAIEVFEQESGEQVGQKVDDLVRHAEEKLKLHDARSAH